MFDNLDAEVASEMLEWGIGGISIALVRDQEIRYARGYGLAQRNSVFRVGSISKLFNAVAVMQEVEAGRLDLDAPLPPALSPLNPFPDAPPVTLRQLLCHRSGLPRESRVGGYFDPTNPGLEATVASLPASTLVTRPGAKTRYSNLGPSVAGRWVEKSSGLSFPEYQQQRVLGPLAMTNSAWTANGIAEGQILDSFMRVADGRGGWRHQRAPRFELGTLPAGNLYSTAEDLARFAMALFRDGAPLIQKNTLRDMWRPQLTDDDVGFGLGFQIGVLGSHRTIGHNGAVYGCSSSFLALPGRKLAAIVLSNEDIVTARVRRLAEKGLLLLLQSEFGELPPLTRMPISAAVTIGTVEAPPGPASPSPREERVGRGAGSSCGDWPACPESVEKARHLSPSLSPARSGGEGEATDMIKSNLLNSTAAPPNAEPHLSALAGDYESESYWARLWVEGEHLRGDLSGQPTRFTPVNRLEFTAADRIDHDLPVVFQEDQAGKVTGFTMGIQRFNRAPETPPVLPPEWRRVLGSYGPDFIPVVISERHGHLYAMTENMVDYRLTPTAVNECSLPPGMYIDENVVFQFGKGTTPDSINFANMVMNKLE